MVATQEKRSGVTLAGLLAVLAGGVALAYEMVLARMLTLAFGGTAIAVTTVLAGYMGGLALGAILAGRCPVQRAPRFLAALQAMAAVLALALPFLLKGVEAAYLFVHPHIMDQLVVRDVVRFCLALPVVVPMAVVAGAILPLLVSARAAAGQGVVVSLSMLYALDTLGAVGGCLVTQLVVLPALGVRSTLAVAAAVSLACAVLALRVHAGEERVAERASPVRRSSKRRRRISASAERVAPAVVLWAFALSGFAALGYEVVATRLLSFHVGISAHAFALVVAAFLTGLSIGSAVCRAFARRVKRPVEVLAFVEIGIGVAGAGLIGVFHRLSVVRMQLVELFGRDTWLGVISIRFVLAFTVLALPALLMGMTLPLAAAALRPSRASEGRATGDAFAANTVGAVLGSAVTGLLLVPVLGTRESILALVAVNLAAAAVLFLWGTPGRTARFGMPVACLVLLGVLVSVFQGVPIEMAWLSPQWRLLMLREGIGGTVTVFEHQPTGGRRLFVNGVGEVGTDINSIRAFELMGHLPFAVDGPRRRAVVVAFGAGITLGAVASHPEVEELECIEICPPVVEATRYFSSYNNDVLADPRSRVYVEDGRTRLASARGRYDLIVLDATHPTTSDSWTLYTRDFYEQCSERLADTGALVQWLPTHGLHPQDYRMALRTFVSVFPNSSLWHSDTHTVLLATPGPQRLDWELVESLFGAPETSRLLSFADIKSPEELIACHVMGSEGLHDFVGEGPLNEDDLAPLQFGESRAGTKDTTPPNLTELLRRPLKLPEVVGLPEGAEGEEVRARLEGRLREAEQVWNGVVQHLLHDNEQAAAIFERVLAVNPDSRDARRWLESLRRSVKND